ncbi:MAG: tyrosine-protein phosphatase [Dehalococcoidales bacterium]
MPSCTREINFEAIINCRDLGGYRAQGKRTVAQRRLFRSGYIHPMTDRDLHRLKEELKLTAVIDLRGKKDKQQLKEISLLNSTGIKYFNTPFLSYQKEELNYDFTDMGEAFLFRIRHQEYGRPIIAALEIIADPKNYPLLFHCGAGKDRSGLLAAFVLSVLGVADADIIADYVLSAHHMKDVVTTLMKDPETPADIKNLPAYTWEATAVSMALFLSGLKREFGSIREYLEMNGAETSLFNRLEKALLI